MKKSTIFMILVNIFIINNFNINAQWSNIGPNYYGSINYSSIAKLDNSIYISSKGSYTDSNPNDGFGTIVKGFGILKSVDGGESWSITNKGLNSLTVRALLAVGNYLYAGTDDGLYSITNNDDTWVKVGNGLINGAIFCLANSNDIILAGADGGNLYVSKDIGATWYANSSIPWNQGYNDRIISLAIDGNNIALIPWVGGVFVSNNTGSTWSSFASGLPQSIYDLNQTIVGIKNNVLYAGNPNGFFYTPLESVDWKPIYTDCGCTSFYFTNSNIYSASCGFRRSLNFNNTWTTTTLNPIITKGFLTFEKDGSQKVFSFSTDSLYYSNDEGVQWHIISSGLHNRPKLGIGIQSVKLLDKLLLAGDQGPKTAIHRTEIDKFSNYPNYIANWKSSITGWNGAKINCFAFEKNATSLKIYAGLWAAGSMYSIDTAKTWKRLDNGLIYGQSLRTINALSWFNSKLYAAVNDSELGKIYSLDPLTNKWIPKSNGLNELHDLANFQDLANNDTVLLTTTWENGLYMSKDGGNNWYSKNNTIKESYKISISDSLIAIGCTNHNGDSPGIYISKNFGKTWTTSNLGLADRYITAIIITNNIIFASTRGGKIFCSTDTARSWFEPDRNLICKNVNGFTVNDSMIFAATDNGVWCSKINTLLSQPNRPNNLTVKADISEFPCGVSLSWSSAVNAVYYRIQVATDANFSNIVFDTTGMQTTSIKLKNLSCYQNYYFRVASVNTVSMSCSNEVYFNLEPKIPDKPGLLFPTNSSIEQPTDFYLGWSGASRADKYSIQVSTKSDFSSTIVDLSGLTTAYYEAKGLANGTKYYWRVKATNDTGWSKWSDIWNFTTYILQIPNKPNLNFPQNNMTNRPPNEQVNWSNVGADKYALQVSTTSDFSSNIVDVSDLTSTYYDLFNLTHSTKYYWRVRAANIIGWSSWSDTWNFTTYLVTTIEENNKKSDFKIYPNPTNSFFYIEGVIRDYSILIVSMDGKVFIKKEMHENLSKIDLSPLPIGTYFIKLTNKNCSITTIIIKQ